MEAGWKIRGLADNTEIDTLSVRENIQDKKKAVWMQTDSDDDSKMVSLCKVNRRWKDNKTKHDAHCDTFSLNKFQVSLSWCRF